jgi:hypothetical protein
VADTPPGIRLSPDNKDVAIRTAETIATHPTLHWRTTSGLWLSDAEVSDWTPLDVRHHAHVNHSNGDRADVSIPREAVDAGARAIMRSAYAGDDTQWDKLQPTQQHIVRERAMAVLNAAATPLVSGQRVIDCASICLAIEQDERAQADAVDPEVHRPSADYLAGYRAATARAQEVVLEWTVEPVRAQS